MIRYFDYLLDLSMSPAETPVTTLHQEKCIHSMKLVDHQESLLLRNTVDEWWVGIMHVINPEHFLLYNVCT